MPAVTVGGRERPVSWAEYLACIMPKGTLIRFRRRSHVSGPMEQGVGIFNGIMFYDGITAYVDIGGRTVYLFLSEGDRMKRLKRTDGLPFVAEGI